MKYTRLLLLFVSLFLIEGQLIAQSEKSKKKTEKVIIIHESEEGEEERQEIIIEQVDEGENIRIRLNGEEIEIGEDIKWVEEDIERQVEDAMKNVEIELKQLEGMNSFNFKFTDENGEEQVIEWEGMGDLPAEIMEDLKNNGVYLHNGSDTFISDDGEVEIIIDEDGQEEVIIIKEKRKGKSKEKKEGKHNLMLQELDIDLDPATDQLRLKFEGKKAPLSLKIMDVSGKTIYKEKQKKFEGRFDKSIDLKGVSDGMLIISIEQEGHLLTEKVMLERS